MNPNYLFICRDGSTEVFTSVTAPTADDLERIPVGLLDVIRLADLRRLDKNGLWQPIPEGAMTSVIIDGRECGPFHVPNEML